MKFKIIITFIILLCARLFGEQKVNLLKPYPKSYDDAPTDKIPVQYAVIQIARQAGYKYNWDTSYNNTNPDCRKWSAPYELESFLPSFRVSCPN